MSNTGQAWVTLATNDSYALGALVLAQSLKRSNTIHQLAILVTPGVSSSMKAALSSAFDCIKEVDVLDSKDSANLALLARPDLGITFTKLHCWTLTQYTKCVFLDADTLVVKNADELFEREELSAAPDAGWPDCFNSGVFVYTPSEDTYRALLDFALANGSFDGGDQGLLNMFFSDWATKDITKHLPFIYNVVASATYSYLPAFKMYGSRVKIAHFIGSSKPWLQAQPGSSTLSEFLNLWWNIFLTDVSQKLNTEMNHYGQLYTQKEDIREEPLRRAESYENIPTTISPPFSPSCVEQNFQPKIEEPQEVQDEGGLAGALAGGQKEVIEDQWRKQSWEQGNIDYMGMDAFENIWKKIASTVSGEIKPIEEPVAAPVEDKPSGSPEKTEEKTDSSDASAAEVETKQPEGEAKLEPATPVASEEQGDQAEALPAPAGETTKETIPQQLPAEQAQVQPEVTVQAVPATVIEEPPVPTKEPVAIQGQEASQEDAAPVVPSEPLATVTPTAPVVPSEPLPTESTSIPAAGTETASSPVASTEPAPSPAVSHQPPAAATEPAPAAPTEPSSTPASEPAQSPAAPVEPSTPTTVPEPTPSPAAPVEPSTPTAASEPNPSPQLKQPPGKKSSSLPKDDPPPEPPKDGGAEKILAEPTTPTSPSVPSPTSPSAPEGTTVDVQPKSPPAPIDVATPAPETSTPPLTPTGEAAPVPPKRRSTKGKGKK